MLVRKRRVCPTDTVAKVQLVAGWLDQFGTADDVKPFRRQLRNEQLAALIEHPDLIAILDEVNRAPTRFRDSGQVFPDAVAVTGIKTAQLAVAVNPIDIITEPNWCRDDGVKGICVFPRQPRYVAR